MNGFFDVKLIEAPDLDRAAIDSMLERGKATPDLDRELASRPLARRVRGSNLVFDNFAGYVFRWMMSGPGISLPFERDAGNAYLATILLETTDSEPTYQEYTGDTYADWDSVAGSIGNSIGAAKRFVEDDVEPHSIVSDPGSLGREAIRFRSRFLWATGEGNSANIRSIAAWFCDVGSTSGNRYRSRSARIRLKDPGGTPVVVEKTSSHVLAVQYDFTLLAI